MVDIIEDKVANGLGFNFQIDYGPPWRKQLIPALNFYDFGKEEYVKEMIHTSKEGRDYALINMERKTGGSAEFDNLIMTYKNLFLAHAQFDLQGKKKKNRGKSCSDCRCSI